jgi:uncharacterized repeat protein (TIGR04076 family)
MIISDSGLPAGSNEAGIGHRTTDVDPTEAAHAAHAPHATTPLHDLRLVVDRIEGRSVCGMAVGDYCEVSGSSQLSIPAGRHFCLYALASALPLLPAKQRPLAPGDWMAKDAEIACPDPDERLIMRVERRGIVEHRTDGLT